MGPTPKVKLCICGGSVADGNRNPQGSETGVPGRSVIDLLGWEAEAEERRAAGRRIDPEAVTVQKAGYIGETPA